MEYFNNNIGNIIKIFASIIEKEAKDQIISLANYHPYLENKIRIMPDVHAGKGCTIGTTMTIKDKITPNLVGVDIGCGMIVVKLEQKDIDLKLLQNTIVNNIPHGFGIRDKALIEFNELNNLTCKEYMDISNANRSIGTLGGGKMIAS